MWFQYFKQLDKGGINATTKKIKRRKPVTRIM